MLTGCLKTHNFHNQKKSFKILDYGSQGVLLSSVEVKNTIEECVDLSFIILNNSINWDFLFNYKTFYDVEYINNKMEIVETCRTQIVYEKIGVSFNFRQYIFPKKNIFQMNFIYNELNYKLYFKRDKDLNLLKVSSEILNNKSKDGLEISNMESSNSKVGNLEVQLKFIEKKK
jgi:hypothetical protein